MSQNLSRANESNDYPESENSHCLDSDCEHHGALQRVPDINDEPSDTKKVRQCERFRSITYQRKQSRVLYTLDDAALTLYDRTIPLAGYTEDIPLYTICRAWVQNNTDDAPTVKKQWILYIHRFDRFYCDDCFRKRRVRKRAGRNVYKLPPPNKPFETRIPSPTREQLAANKDAINLNYDESTAPSKDTLLASHHARWRSARNKSKQTAAANESRYDASNKILKKLFRPLMDNFLSQN